MARWMTYARERFPLANYLLLSAGIALSAGALQGGALRIRLPVFALVGIMLIFFQKCLMNDYKNAQKDILENPTFPIPRGLLTSEEVRRTIAALESAMVVFALGLYTFLGMWPALTFMAVILYLHLFLQDFYAADWFELHLLLKKSFENGIFLFVCAFAASVRNPEDVLQWSTLAYGLTVAAAFFTYDISKLFHKHASGVNKLNQQVPLQQAQQHTSQQSPQTTVQKSGFVRIFAVVVASTSLASLGASQLQLQNFVNPLSAFVLFSFLCLYFKPQSHKSAKIASGLFLVACLWAPLLSLILRVPLGRF